MPGETFITAGDIGRELGFVSDGVLDIIYKDSFHGESVLRSVYGESMEMPTIVGEIAFFLNTQQPYKVQTDTERAVQCAHAFFLPGFGRGLACVPLRVAGRMMRGVCVL